jgi:hypothetical protein
MNQILTVSDILELTIPALFRTSGAVAGKKIGLTQAIDPEQVKIITVPNGNYYQMIVTFQGEILVRGEREIQPRVTLGLRVAMENLVA